MYLLDTTRDKKEKHHIVDGLETILAENSKSLGTFDPNLNVLSPNVVDKIQKNSLLKKTFKEFLVRERSEENLDFLSDIESMRVQIDRSQREKLALEIYLKYIEKGKVNIPWSIRVKVTENVANQNFSASMFDDCKAEICTLLKSDTLERFFKSSQFGLLKMRYLLLKINSFQNCIAMPRSDESDGNDPKIF